MASHGPWRRRHKFSAMDALRPTTAEAPVDGDDGPRASKEEILACQFSSWYDDFRNLSGAANKNCTIKSVIVPLPPIFIEYLRSDGVRLPDGATKLSSCAPAHEDDWWSSDEDGDNDDEEEDSIDGKRYSFPELNEQISEGIASLGGAVLPKLNWSSPKDATWVNNGTMKCETPGDVYILLKSSDFVSHDIQHTFDGATGNDAEADKADGDDTGTQFKFELALRKWSNLHASQEFRCFVSDHELVAISQRNHTQHYPHLSRESMTIRSRIVDFFVDSIQRRFASGSIAKYVFDCYVDKNRRVWLLDFNPWSIRTDSLLFDWDNLQKLAADVATSGEGKAGEVEDEGKTDDAVSCENVRPCIKVVETELEVHHDPIASFRAPIDTVDLMSDADGANSFQNFMAMCERPSEM